MTRAIIYARVSTEDQVEKYGLSVQYRECNGFCAARGYTVTETISDDGITGTTMERPGLSRVRDLVAAGSVDVIVTLDVDRLSRELVHLLILKPEIEKRARLEFVNATFEDSPNGRLFFGMRGLIAQFERENMLQRMGRGKRERARSGKVLGGRVAFGYLYDNATGTLSIDPERAPVVRQIFEWFTTGVAVRQIAQRLREAGVRSHRGKKWGKSTVRRMLENETFAGVAHYGTMRRQGAVMRRATAHQRIPIVVPAIISREMWDRAQARIGDVLPVGRPSTSCLLRGLLYCPCGRRMVGDGATGSSYRCNGRDRLRHQGAACSYAVTVRKLDEVVWKVLVATFTDAATLRRVLREYQQSIELSGPERSDALLRQVRTLRAREERCLSLLMDEDLVEARAELKARYVEAQRERAAAERALAGIEAQARKRKGLEGGWVERTAALLRKYLPTLTDRAERQAVAQGLISRAEWTEVGDVKLHCFFAPEMAQSLACSGLSRKPAEEPIQFVVTARVAA